MEGIVCALIYLAVSCVYATSPPVPPIPPINRPDLIAPPGTVDYARINEIKQECAEKQNIGYYNIYILNEDTEVNKSVKCAVECEMKARNFTNEDGTLDMDTVTEEYYKEKFVNQNDEKAKVGAAIVLNLCSEKWKKEESEDSCDKAYKFQRCLIEESEYYYQRIIVKDCLFSLQGKNDTNVQHLRYQVEGSSCIVMSPYCYMDIQRYAAKKGVDNLKSVAEETGFLEGHPSEKESFFNNTGKCFDERQTAKSDDCNKEIKFHTCLVAEFQQIIRLVRPS